MIERSPELHYAALVPGAHQTLARGCGSGESGATGFRGLFSAPQTLRTLGRPLQGACDSTVSALSVPASGRGPSVAAAGSLNAWSEHRRALWSSVHDCSRGGDLRAA